MAAKIDIVVNELDFKIEKLIKQYIHSLEENKSLKDDINELKNKLEILEEEKHDLENKLKTVRTANAVARGEYNKDGKSQINRLVREIDKCIALLNN